MVRTMKTLRVRISADCHKRLVALQGYYQGLDGLRVGLAQAIELTIDGQHKDRVNDGTLMAIEEENDLAKGG